MQTIPQERGGGIYAGRFTKLTLVDSDSSQNQAGSSGGGVWLYGDSTVERSTFVSNITLQTGGGLYVAKNGIVEVRNSTFSANQAGAGLAKHVSGGGGGIGTKEQPKLLIYNCTITGNHLTTSDDDVQGGGGIYGRGTDGDSYYIKLYSTIVAGNTSGNDYADIGGTFTCFTNCLIQVTNHMTIVGANNIFDQPALLGDLADNGGLTRTHALSSSSPAINAGNNPEGLQTDQRGTGFPRQYGDNVDIGAFELSDPLGTIFIIK